MAAIADDREAVGREDSEAREATADADPAPVGLEVQAAIGGPMPVGRDQVDQVDQVDRDRVDRDPRIRGDRAQMGPVEIARVDPEAREDQDGMTVGRAAADPLRTGAVMNVLRSTRRPNRRA